MIAVDQASESWVANLRHKNPLDHLGRSATMLACMAKEGSNAGVSLCTACGEELRLCYGDEVAPYLSHQCSEFEHRCPGSFETVWHLAAKRAASRIEGWSAEKRYEIDGRTFRADAMDAARGMAFEAVHSLSRDYVSKHIATKTSGLSVQWLFDGGASFCRPLQEMPFGFGKRIVVRFDCEYAKQGQLVAKGCLRRKARQLVCDLGVEDCYMHFAGFAFRCFSCSPDGEDVWELCNPGSFVSRVVYGDGGLNDELIRARASGIEVTAHGLGTNHTPEASELIQQVVRYSILLDYRRLDISGGEAKPRAGGGQASSGRWVPPEEWPGVLVNLPTPCRCGARFGVDVPIHQGDSTRRDCAECGRFIEFTRWQASALRANACGPKQLEGGGLCG
jgi:hypothetical protein